MNTVVIVLLGVSLSFLPSHYRGQVILLTVRAFFKHKQVTIEEGLLIVRRQAIYVDRYGRRKSLVVDARALWWEPEISIIGLHDEKKASRGSRRQIRAISLE
jgi:hypothetical protein